MPFSFFRVYKGILHANLRATISREAARAPPSVGIVVVRRSASARVFLLLHLRELVSHVYDDAGMCMTKREGTTRETFEKQTH